jgi:hypothetical protein
MPGIPFTCLADEFLGQFGGFGGAENIAISPDLVGKVPGDGCAAFMIISLLLLNVSFLSL